MLTSEQRMLMNAQHKIEGHVLCSVCDKKFENAYSLSNHYYKNWQTNEEVCKY